jgi:hypothetical protein
MESSVFNIAKQRNKGKHEATSTIAMTKSKQCIVVTWTLENTYVTIKWQVLPNLLTPASTRKESAPFYF